MQVDINFVYTDEARAIAVAQPQLRGWQAPDIAMTPIQGDLISFGDEDTPIFEVVNRLFIWKNPGHLVVQPLLGVWPRQATDQS